MFNPIISTVSVVFAVLILVALFLLSNWVNMLIFGAVGHVLSIDQMLLGFWHTMPLTVLILIIAGYFRES